MPTYSDAKRDAARRLFEQIERALGADATLGEKDEMRLMVRKAEEDHHSRSRKRFDADEFVRQRLIYPVIDDVVARWCRTHDLRADPFNCFKYKGAERGPTQHQTGIGPSERTVRHYFERIDEAAPILGGRGAEVLKSSRASA